MHTLYRNTHKITTHTQDNYNNKHNYNNTQYQQQLHTTQLETNNNTQETN